MLKNKIKEKNWVHCERLNCNNDKTTNKLAQMKYYVQLMREVGSTNYVDCHLKIVHIYTIFFSI